MTNAHDFHPTILREYDVRGVVGDTLSEADAGALGAAFGTRVVAAGGRSVAVGFDGRSTSPGLSDALMTGLQSCGLHVHNVGVGPTPMLSFAIKHLDTDAGVMVTGSHNPPDYNGFKMTLLGKPFFGPDIPDLARIAAAADYAVGEGAMSHHDVRAAYVDRLVAELGATDIQSQTVWDPGNGAGADILNSLIARLPGTHHVINGTIDGTFPNHHPDPTVAENLVQLQDEVARTGADLGIAFDGDADRIGVIDAQGRIIWADQLILIYAADILSTDPGATIIADVKSSQVLFDEIDRLGGNAIMWNTGHSIIKSKMAIENAPLAGEMSGHIFFADRYYGFDDALYAGVRLLGLLQRQGKTLAQLLDAIPTAVNTPELRFPCDETRKFTVVDEVKARLAADGAAVNDIDGVRVKNADGWWLVRASNTQDVLVARCESSTEAGLERLKQQVVAQLRASGIEPPADL